MWAVRIGMIAAAATCVAFFSAEPRPSVAGAVIVVQTTADEVQFDGLCSLRQAIQSANINAAIDCTAGTGPNDVIQIPDNLYVLDPTELLITESVTIVGQSQTGTIINGNNGTRIFRTSGFTSLTLRDLALRGGNGEGALQTGNGGAVYHAGDDLTFERVTVESNRAQSGGGGIYFAGTSATDDFTITDSTIRDNRVTQPNASTGGGIVTIGNTTISDSTITGNGTQGEGPRFGGGLAAGSALGPRTLTITDTLFSGNRADFVGGGFDTAFATTLTRVEISDNTAGNAGGGASFANEQMLIADSLITRNVASGTNSASGISNAGTMVITNSVISDNGGPTSGNGGGIRNQSNFIVATLTVSGSTISGNQTSPNHGGGAIFNSADESVTIVDSTIDGNTAGHGGAIWNLGSMTVSRSTISANDTAPGVSGAGASATGAIEADASSLDLTNVTISGNTGGALATVSGGAATLQNVTIVAEGDSGVANGGTVATRNTIFAGGAPNCSGSALNSFGANLEDANDCGLAAAGDMTNTEPLLGPLANNGGPTLTHALLQGSPAIDAGTSANCPIVDQRGQPRPQGSACDIGAVESSFSVPTPTPSGPATPTPTGTPQQVIWGDNNCSGAADPVDALLALRFDAGLSTNTGACPGMGTAVDVAGTNRLWGDIDCSLQLPDPVDALKLLRFDAGLPASQAPGCPALGSQVSLVAGGGAAVAFQSRLPAEGR